MLANSFLLVDGLVPLILVMTFDDFESIFHHFHMILHLLELRGRSSRVLLGIVLWFGVNGIGGCWLVRAASHL